MSIIKSAILGAAVLAAIASAPASAVITTFASFSPIGTAANVRWVNSGTNGSNGTGGKIYSTATGSSTVAGSRNVSFSFLQPAIAPFVTGHTAVFTLNGTVASGNPAALAGGFLVQKNFNGTMSFTSTSAITVSNTTYAAGSNLLSVAFGAAAITGARNSTSGSLSGSTSAGSTVLFTSDFLTFTNSLDQDFALSLTSIASPLQAIPSNGIPTRALRNFRAVAGGTFSSDPAPIVNAIPEPQVWGLLVIGFGMVGLQVRRRARQTVVVA